MPARFVPHTEEKRVLSTALWALGGLGLLVLTMFGTAEGRGELAIAAIPAVLAGVFVLVRPELGVMALTSTIFLSYPEVLERIGPFTINTILFGVLGCILFARCIIDRRVDVLKSRQVQFFALLMLAMWVNVLFVDRMIPSGRLMPSPWEGAPIQSMPAFLDSTDRRFQNGYTSALYVLFFVAFIRKRWQILCLVGLVVSFILITSPNAIWNSLTSLDIGENSRAAASIGIPAARNANRLAFLCITAIAFIGYAMTVFRSLAMTLLGGSAIVMLVLTIFLSASRSGFLNLAILSIIFLTRTAIRPAKLIALVCVLAVALVVVLTVVPQTHLDRITNILADERTQEGGGSSIARREMFGLGWQIFLDHPLFGVGMGNQIWTALTDYRGIRQSGLHNSYLNALVEGGIFLLIFYLLLFASTLLSLQRTTRLAARDPEAGLEWVVGATRASFILMLVFCGFADVWFEVPLTFMIGLSATLEIYYRERLSRRPVPVPMAVAA